jgi:hypothetical protein
VAALGLAIVAAACSGNDSGSEAGTDSDAEPPDTTAAERPPPPGVIVLSTEGNNLNAYEAAPPFRQQTVIRNAGDDPGGLDINGQVCLLPPDDAGDPVRFVAGEDTGQPERTPGWGIFELEGDTVDDLEARQVGRLVPTYQTEEPENYGCGVLSDGRVVTSDIGNQASGPPTGQLIVWYPPFDGEDVRYCKLDVALPTPGGIHVVDDYVYVTAARPPDNGVRRYAGPFPTSADAAGGCGRADATGAPLADETGYEVFIHADNHVATPNAVIGAPDSGFYVSSAFTGVLAHYDADGRFVRTLVTPPAGEQLGEEPYSTGSPFGMGVDPTTGDVYWADIAIGIGEGVGPVDGAGTVRRTTFDATGEPRPAEIIDERLDFPDGIGIYVPPG